jgi:hypothetical protein
MYILKEICRTSGTLLTGRQTTCDVFIIFVKQKAGILNKKQEYIH